MEAQWAVGSIQFAYDSAADRVVLVASEVGGPDDEGEAGGKRRGAATKLMRWVPVLPPNPLVLPPGWRSPGEAAAMIEHGKRLLRGGRPPCPVRVPARRRPLLPKDQRAPPPLNVTGKDQRSVRARG